MKEGLGGMLAMNRVRKTIGVDMSAHEKTVEGNCVQAINSLFPASVVVAVAEDWMWQMPVHEQEEALFKGASVKRQQEFRAGRHCAHAALERLGCKTALVLRGEKGEPLWPVGFCGTITHSGNHCAAAAARQRDIMALGLDVEQHEALKPGVLAKIASVAEIARLEILQQKNPGTHYDVLLFSIKEAVYKAYYPLTRQNLGFHDVDVEIDSDSPRFNCRLLKTSNDMTDNIEGRFIVSGQLVGAAVTIAADGIRQAVI